MRIATWNVNSIRSRIDRVTAFLERHDVDVLLMQETKCKDEQLPCMPLEAAGYEVAHVGYNQWNGVAIVSRVGLDDVQIGFTNQPEFKETVEARAIGATCGGVRMWSLYIPNGRGLDDPHYEYKLQWLDALHNYATAEATSGVPLALGGDWNIAPIDDDVWDPTFFDGKTHTSQAERDRFEAFIEGGFTDVVRPHCPGPGTYTYWDYTQLRFPKKQGMRIDFVLGSASFTDRVTGAFIDRDERKGKGASDHAPVVVDLDN